MRKGNSVLAKMILFAGTYMRHNAKCLKKMLHTIIYMHISNDA